MTITGLWWLIACAGFWLSWCLMPGVGVTDTNVIFTLVSQHRPQVFASVILQLLSAAAYAPAAAGLLRSEAARASKAVSVGCVLLLIGAMGSAADAIFHLVAYEMTAPGVDLEVMGPVMRQLQGPDLALLLPFVAAFFAGHALIVGALRHQSAVTRLAFRVLLAVPVFIVLGIIARRTEILPTRFVGLALLLALSTSVALTGISVSKRSPTTT